MYKEKISAWVDAHKDEMLEDICELALLSVWTWHWTWQKAMALRPAITMAM